MWKAWLRDSFRSLMRYLILWLVLPNLVLHVCWWYFTSTSGAPKVTQAPRRALKPQNLKIKPFALELSPHRVTKSVAHNAVLWQEILYQSGRTDFLSSCSRASTEELRFRKDRILMFRKFLKKIKDDPHKEKQKEDIKRRLDLQLLAVENWLNLSADTQATHTSGSSKGYHNQRCQGVNHSMHSPHSADYALFSDFVKFKREFQSEHSR